jgi:signal transduction histidine kinase
MRQGYQSFQRDNPASPSDVPDGQSEVKSQPGAHERVRQIEAEQVRLLYTQAFAGCIATLLNAGIVTVVLWKVVARPLLLGWLTLLIVIVLSLFVLLRLYQRRTPTTDRTCFWRTLFIIGVGSGGTVGGAAGVLLFPYESLIHQVFLTFVLGGMAAGAVVVLSPVLTAFLAVFIPTLLPITVQLFLQRDDIHVSMGFLLLSFAGVLLVIARYQQTSIAESLRFRFEHLDLIHHLSVANSQAGEAKTRTEVELLKVKEMAEAANHAKREFLATMSHELRTPLNVILGYTDLLLEETFDNLSEELAHPLRRIYSNARELLDLINAVLDVSRLEAGRLPIDIKEVQVPALLEDLKAEAQALYQRSGLHFGWDVEAGLAPIRTDPEKLKVVLRNLISNAVKFTLQGSIAVRASAKSGGIEVSVTDTGIGIPPEAMAIIFEPFSQVESAATRQYNGAGLGLHIVKRLLDLLGGAVAVESEVGRGSTFRVWVPRESPTCPEVSSETVL